MPLAFSRSLVEILVASFSQAQVKRDDAETRGFVKRARDRVRLLLCYQILGGLSISSRLKTDLSPSPPPAVPPARSVFFHKQNDLCPTAK